MPVMLQGDRRSPPAVYPKFTEQRKADTLDAVNYVFAMLRDAFPQPFDKAFPTQKDRDRARSLWAGVLSGLDPQQVRAGAIRAVRECTFMPSPGAFRSLCFPSYDGLGLKEPLHAYYEACQHSPDAWSWSHTAVYLAARGTGWALLHGEPQDRAFPVFERNYAILRDRLARGESLEADVPKALEAPDGSAMVEKAQCDAMRGNGIDPDGGRAEFLKVMREL